MNKIKLITLMVILFTLVLTTQRIDAARNDGTTVKIDCEGFDLQYVFKTTRNNIGSPAGERILFVASDGTGTAIYREEKTFSLSEHNVDGRIKSDWTTPPSVNPLKFQLISEEGNGYSMDVFFTKTETCKKLPSNVPTSTPFPGKADLFIKAQARQHPLVQSSVDTYLYYLTFGNQGTNIALSPITITDTLPAGITLASAITGTTTVTCTSSGQKIVWIGAVNDLSTRGACDGSVARNCTC